MKTLKMLYAAIILAAALSILNYAKYEDSTGKEVHSFSVRKGGTLIVNVNPGEITIVPWSKNEVSVVTLNMDKDEQQNIKFTSANNTIRVEYDSNWGDEEGTIFTINVPAKFNLDLLSKTGRIYVNGNIEGTLTAKTYAGDIDVKNVKGDVVLNTNGGEITTGNIEGGLSVNTMGGDITTGRIEGSTAKIITMGGDISVKNSTARIYAKTMGGDVTVGDIGGGSELTTFGGSVAAGKVNGSVKLDTYGGDINLLGAAGEVSARTMGGNLTLKNVTGSITAKNYSGNIIAELSPEINTVSNISTTAGSIVLYVPVSANTQITAKAKIHGKRGPEKINRKIISDFEETDYKDNDRYAEANYILNGGLSNINLTSTEAGIKILKKNK